MTINSEKTIFSIKRLMGKKYSDLKDEEKKMPYKVVSGNNGMACVQIDERVYTPQEISAMILQKMKKTAEDYLGCEVTKAVITVPAYFNDAERTATKEAGEVAGLEVLRIINEPTAASLAFHSDKQKEGKIGVYDFGGGTFDISILDIDSGVIEVKSTDGNVHLGGDNLDEALINFIADDFKNTNGVDLRKDVMALARLREAAEKAKVELSSSSSTEINLPYITVLDNIPQHLTKNITRSDFERIVDNIVKMSVEPCNRALSNSGFKKEELSDILLVGGSTRVPLAQEYVKRIFGKEGNKSVNPDEVVAVGAAIQGAVLSGDKNDILLLDVVALSYGIETLNGVFTKMVESNTTIPTSKKETFSTAADNQNAVTINVGQGERPMFSQNKSLGTFNLDGIMPAQRGTPKIEVTFDIDANGILKVSAKDLGTGKDNHITIQGNSSLSKEEIERMKADAEMNKDADEKLKKEVETINEADSLVFNTEKQMKDDGIKDKLTSEDTTSLNEIIVKLKDAISVKNFDDIAKLKEELQQKWYSISAKIYASQDQANKANENCDCGDTCNNDCKKDDVQDVNFEDVSNK